MGMELKLDTLDGTLFKPNLDLIKELEKEKMPLPRPFGGEIKEGISKCLKDI